MLDTTRQTLASRRSFTYRGSSCPLNASCNLGGAVNLNFLIRVAKVTSAMAIMGMTAYGIAGCSHDDVATASSSATPAVEPGVTTYLCRFTNEDMLLQWNASNGSISGTYQDATISGTTPQEQVNTSQGDLGGTTSSSGGITLNIGTETWYRKSQRPLGDAERSPDRRKHPASDVQPSGRERLE